MGARRPHTRLMLRIRDHEQKLAELHNLTASHGLIGTQALLRRPPAAREGQEEERDNERHHSLTIGSQNRNPVADSNRLTTETDDKASGNTASSPSDDRLPIVNSSSLGSSANDSQFQTSVLDQSGTQTSEASNGSSVSSSQEREAPLPPNVQSKSKRLPLTARETLRAAKVLQRYNTETKQTKKSDRGKNVLDALRDNERGKKRSGLPEAPTNIFDDSKRGMPKQGLTWDFPGGADLFLIIFSFVFISTVIFATTYVVWKLGAIHFSEN